MKVTVTKRSGNISTVIDKQRRQLQTVPTKAYQYFVSVTPKRSGNARRETDLIGNTIRADYSYAQRLNKGYSKKAPKGMTIPMIQYLKKLVKDIMGRG
jgi:hypothetical protein